MQEKDIIRENWPILALASIFLLIFFGSLIFNYTAKACKVSRVNTINTKILNE